MATAKLAEKTMPTVTSLAAGDLIRTIASDASSNIAYSTLLSLIDTYLAGQHDILTLASSSVYADLATCISTLGSVNTIDLVISRAEAFSGTIPVNYRLHFYGDGEITVANSDVTIAGEIVTAGLKRIFKS